MYACRAVWLYVWVTEGFWFWKVILQYWFFFRIGHCKGFALGTYLLFNVAAMLWQVSCKTYTCEIDEMKQPWSWFFRCVLHWQSFTFYHPSLRFPIIWRQELKGLRCMTKAAFGVEVHFRFLSKWGAWLAASYISCLPVQLVSSALYLSFDDHQVKIQASAISTCISRLVPGDIFQRFDETLFTCRRRMRR